MYLSMEGTPDTSMGKETTSCRTMQTIRWFKNRKENTHKSVPTAMCIDKEANTKRKLWKATGQEASR